MSQSCASAATLLPGAILLVMATYPCQEGCTDSKLLLQLLILLFLQPDKRYTSASQQH